MTKQLGVRKTKPRIKAKGKSRRRSRIDRSVEEISFAVGRSVLGALLVASSEKGVVAIIIGTDADELTDDLQRRFPNAHLVGGSREDLALVRRVAEHIATPSRPLDLTLDLRGTAFQKRVWKAVREIPAGQTSTYTEIARQIGSPKAIRAVGNACSQNYLSFVIPCHRILRSDGTFHGRHLVAEEVRALLAREAGLA
jgi:AraC family transcriptional regulator of adaptative response/methylated-DNA-[protein]-cysteine methyltransferase